MAKGWIQGAIKHPGALKRKAAAAGEGTMQFAHQHAGDGGTTGKQARLAEELQGFGHHSKPKVKKGFGGGVFGK